MTAPISDRAGIRQVYRALKAAGFTPTYTDNGAARVKVVNEAQAIDELTATDEGVLFVSIPNEPDRYGYVYFVLGNEPYEVVCDHTVNLSVVLDPLTESWDE